MDEIESKRKKERSQQQVDIDADNPPDVDGMKNPYIERERANLAAANEDWDDVRKEDVDSDDEPVSGK